MKGKLVKTDKGWFVRYRETTPLSITTEILPLHPSDVEQINMDSQVFDNIEARIAAYPEVEFEMVTEYWSGEVGVNGLTYAKLIHHSVEPNEMIEDTFKVWECCGMEECICKENVEKLAETEYPIFDGDLLSITHNQKHSRIDFIKGYNKAKETLYTEEQVREAIELARGIKDDEMTFDISSITGCGEMCTYGWKEEYSSDEIIQSLKQPKQ